MRKTLEKRQIGRERRQKTSDFSDLYKSAADTNNVLGGKIKIIESQHVEDVEREANPVIFRDSSKKRNKKRTFDIKSRDKSLSNDNDDKDQKPKVKSIMKNCPSNSDDVMNESIKELAIQKRKKRNKSVSFVLDDNEVATKKTKGDESLKIVLSNEDSPGCSTKTVPENTNKKYKTKKFYNKSNQAEKENKVNHIEGVENENNNIKSKVIKKSRRLSNSVLEKKKKFRRTSDEKTLDDTFESVGNDSSNKEEEIEVKEKKHKKKKRQAKPVQTSESMQTEGEPQIKLFKKDAKPDVIAEDLGNLSIGDNAHTLTNLLHGMTVADKNKRKKNKLKRKKEKHRTPVSTSSSETVDLERIEEGKEKVIWKKRKWNKDKKGEIDENSLVTSVIIENLPLKIIMTYKKLLLEHFSKFGPVKKIGIAEVYSTEESEPVFTTTINFINEAAATQALGEDDSLFEGNYLRVKRPLPPAKTTLVVRSYGSLSEQSISSLFLSAGKIRSIKQLVKGKKSMATAFVEFDGPEAVSEAIKIAEGARIGGKKIYVSKFELKSRKTKNKHVLANNLQESENEGDSEDSND